MKVISSSELKKILTMSYTTVPDKFALVASISAGQTSVAMPGLTNYLLNWAVTGLAKSCKAARKKKVTSPEKLGKSLVLDPSAWQVITILARKALADPSAAPAALDELCRSALWVMSFVLQLAGPSWVPRLRPLADLLASQAMPLDRRFEVISGLATVVLHLLSGWLPVVVREVRSGLYSRTAFFVAFAIFDIVPFRVIPALLFGSITYWMAGLQEEPAKFLTFELYVVLVAGASSGMFLALGALLHRTPLLLGMAGALVHLGFMLFGGFLLNVQNVQPAIAWLLDVSPVRYAFQALMFNELNGIAFNFDPKAGNFPQSTLDASILIRQFGSGDGGTWLPAYALAGLWASGIAVALVVLLTAALR